MNEPVLARLQQLMNLREEVETLGSARPWTPAADWIDNDSHLTLLLDVPGVNLDSLALSEEDDTVTIQGERPTPDQTLGHVLSAERASGKFTRTLVFPEAVLPQSGEARLSAGVLTIQFEKRHPTIDATAQELGDETEES
ncbi:Hsp20/alpha crystallin family protein [Deinococcus aquatilis]|jgi:HSP20 family protein|uniref:Hsp20/alpha crystallin family protein n=1 Tax=Deinococcus aquatilis TaxID=519440 RepID=UPI00037E7A46|nr:Hsp20/alpha crystallin family protein [Deinococcus aquatilis]